MSSLHFLCLGLGLGSGGLAPLKPLTWWELLYDPLETSCGRNLDDIIESLGASETSLREASPADEQSPALPQREEEAAAEAEALKELRPDGDAAPAEEDRGQDEEEVEDCELTPSLEESPERRFGLVGQAEPVSGLRRRNRPQ